MALYKLCDDERGRYSRRSIKSGIKKWRKNQMNRYRRRQWKQYGKIVPKNAYWNYEL